MKYHSARAASEANPAVVEMFGNILTDICIWIAALEMHIQRGSLPQNDLFEHFKKQQEDFKSHPVQWGVYLSLLALTSPDLSKDAIKQLMAAREMADLIEFPKT